MDKYCDCANLISIAFDELNAGHPERMELLFDTKLNLPKLFFDQNTTVFAFQWCLRFRDDYGIWASNEVPEHWLHYLSERGNATLLAHYYSLSSQPMRRPFSCPTSAITMQHLDGWRWMAQQKPCDLSPDTQKYIQSLDSAINEAFAPHMSLDCQSLMEQYAIHPLIEEDDSFEPLPSAYGNRPIG
jgi:hypothetical protein